MKNHIDRQPQAQPSDESLEDLCKKIYQPTFMVRKEHGQPYKRKTEYCKWVQQCFTPTNKP